MSLLCHRHKDMTFYLVAVLAGDSPFSCKASPFCCISTEQQERRKLGFYSLLDLFPSNVKNTRRPLTGWRRTAVREAFWLNHQSIEHDG